MTEEAQRVKNMGGDLKFKADDLGYFDPELRMVDQNGMNTYQGKTSYKYMRNFLEAIQAATTTCPDYVVRANLWKCLKGSAQTWYNAQLPLGAKEFLRGGRGLQNWTQLLTRRYKRPLAEVYREMESQRFTQSDIAAGKPIAAFAMNVVRNLQDAGYDQPTDSHKWIAHIFSKLDPDFQLSIPDPTDNPDVRFDDFLQLLETRAKVWQQKAKVSSQNRVSSKREREQTAKQLPPGGTTAIKRRKCAERTLPAPFRKSELVV